MATLGTVGQKADKNYLQNLFDENKLQVVRPSTNFTSIIRPIAQVAEDGTILPMVLGSGPQGLDFSALLIDTIVDGSGVNQKFTGFVRASDRMDGEDPQQIFSGLYIRAKGRDKNGRWGELDPAIIAKIRQLLVQKTRGKNNVGYTELAKPQQVAFMQCIILQLNDKPCEKPRTNQALMMSQTAALSLNKLLTQAHKDKIDVFSPEAGYTLVLRGIPADPTEGRTVPVFKFELGEQLPINPDTNRKLWKDWRSACRYLPLRDHITKACAAFGHDVVRALFPEEYAMCMTAAPAAAVAPAAPAAPAAPSAPAAPVQTVAPSAPAQPPPAQPGPQYKMATKPALEVDTSMPPPLDDAVADEAPAAGAGGAKPQPSKAEMVERYRKLIDG